MELKWAADTYTELGSKTRSDLSYKGHPNEKQPDLLASLLYRVQQAILTKVGGEGKTALARFVQENTNLESAPRATALQALHVMALRATTPEQVRATRCFMVQKKEGDKTRWVAVASGDQDLSLALKVCQQRNPLRPIGVERLPGDAPQSEVSELAFGSSSGDRGQKGGTKTRE